MKLRSWIGRSLVALACVTGVLEPARGQAPMPQQQMQGAIAFLNGGAGDEEVDFIRRSMKDYSLALAFSRAGTPRAEYVASVAITIKDGKGDTVFETPSAGPYILIRLPAGKYSVVASYHDVTQTRPVTAARSASSVTTFIWS